MDRIVDGYLFGSDKDAKLAKQESDKILFLENRINYSNPKSVLAIYQKAVENRVFSTPVGMTYLKKLQEYLKENGLGEEAGEIPLYMIFSGSPEPEKQERPQRRRVTPTKQAGYKRKYFTSLIINLLLVFLVILMFAVTLTGKNPNITNYENRLLDKYSSWEQELTEREQVIREKEKELNIQE